MRKETPVTRRGVGLGECLRVKRHRRGGGVLLLMWCEPEGRAYGTVALSLTRAARQTCGHGTTPPKFHLTGKGKRSTGLLER